MIITGKRETYDGSWRIVNYATETGGRLTPVLEKSFADAEIPQYLEQQARNFERLRQRLLAGEISAVGFYVELTGMNVEDLAARMRLRRSAVRAHLTPAGFAKIRVKELEGYARHFDVSVADFFQIAVLEAGVSVAHSRNPVGRLLQTVVFAPARPEDDATGARTPTTP
jgi:hypothetical protein